MSKLMPDDLQMWERQPGEGPQAFEAFALYRDQLDRRSTRKVAQQLGKSETLVHRWCSRWHWVRRARDYDRYLDWQHRQDREVEIREFRKRALEQCQQKILSLMLPDVAISIKLQDPNALQELAALSVSDLLALSSRCATSLSHLLKTEGWAAITDVNGGLQAQDEDDLISRAVAEDDEAMSLAAALLDRASSLNQKP